MFQDKNLIFSGHGIRQKFVCNILPRQRSKETRLQPLSGFEQGKNAHCYHSTLTLQRVRKL